LVADRGFSFWSTLHGISFEFPKEKKSLDFGRQRSPRAKLNHGHCLFFQEKSASAQNKNAEQNNIFDQDFETSQGKL
jgi:hypothetical protein